MKFHFLERKYDNKWLVSIIVTKFNEELSEVIKMENKRFGEHYDLYNIIFSGDELTRERSAARPLPISTYRLDFQHTGLWNVQLYNEDYS
jgi:hypothetical protein